MKWSVKLTLLTLSVAFAIFAVKELLSASSPSVGTIAFLMLIMAVAGITEALRKYPRE